MSYALTGTHAIAQDPFDKKTIYYGSQYLHKSTNKGASWETISPDLTTNDTVKINAFRIPVDLPSILPAQKHIADSHYCTIFKRKRSDMGWY